MPPEQVVAGDPEADKPDGRGTEKDQPFFANRSEVLVIVTVQVLVPPTSIIDGEKA